MRLTTALLAAGLCAAGATGAAAAKNCENTESFEGWLSKFRSEAARQGIKPQTIAAVLNGMTLDRTVIARDRRQSFFAQTFLDFSAKLATNNRVQNSRSYIRKYRSIFDRAEADYGVPAAVITAFWALESDFGAGMGKFPVLRALATLAYDCRRGEMFQDELLAAMKIIDRGDLSPDEMIGSWAGELGQTQFLPTHYLNHALDYDGDGRRDLIRSVPDIIGSTASFMQHLGWRRGEPWLQEVRVPGQMPWDQADLAIQHPRSKWVAWGVRAVGGEPLPRDSLPAALLLPMGRNGPAFLAYPNFQVYLQWNQSLNYATTAAYLATRVDGAPPMSRGNGQVESLDFNQMKELQAILARRGYDVGDIDGRLGAGTRAAVKAVQMKLGFPADSYPTPELLAALRGSR